MSLYKTVCNLFKKNSDYRKQLLYVKERVSSLTDTNLHYRLYLCRISIVIDAKAGSCQTKILRHASLNQQCHLMKRRDFFSFFGRYFDLFMSINYSNFWQRLTCSCNLSLKVTLKHIHSTT